MTSAKKLYPKTYSFLETDTDSSLASGWHDYCNLHDDRSSAALIAILLNAYQLQTYGKSRVELVEHIHEDSKQLIESGASTLPVYLMAYWSRFTLRIDDDPVNAPATFFELMSTLYGEASIRGAATATAFAFSKVAEETLDPYLRTSLAAVEAAASFSSWAERWNPSTLACWHSKLDRIAHDTMISSGLRAAAAYPLAWTPSDVTGIDGREIARFAFAEFHSLYSPLQLVCLLGRIADGDGPMMKRFLPDIIGMIEHHVSARAINPLSELDSLLERADGLQIVGTIIRTLVQAGQDADAVTVIAIWLGINREDIRISRLVTLLMSQSVGAVLAAEGRVRYIAKPRTITPLLQVLNKSTRESVRNLNDITWIPELHDPRFSRIPDPLQAATLIAALQEYLPVHEANDLLTSNEASALLAVPAFPIPLQGWLLHSLGSTMPLTVSLRRPKPDRSVNRVLLWAEGPRYSEIERIELDAIFKRAGIAVDMPGSHTAAEFEERYTSNLYDLIWIASHGTYEPSEPYLSRLQVGLNEWVDTRILRKPPQSEARRLLVLNACEGGATFVGGGLLDSGLAASATSESQAVIAHLWPIRDWPNAVGFAVVLAFLLVSQPEDFLPGFKRTFFEAYQQCLRILSKGPDYVRSFIGGMGRPPSALDTRLEHIDSVPYYRWPATFVDWAGCTFYE